MGVGGDVAHEGLVNLEDVREGSNPLPPGKRGAFSWPFACGPSRSARCGISPVPGFGRLDVASNDLPSLTFYPPTCITTNPRKDHSSTRDPDEAA